MVDPNIKKKADDIRRKIYGSDVRESLASGLEEMSEDVVDTKGRQDEVEGQFQDVLDETTNKDFNSAPEIRAARDGNPNLKARLDKEHNEVTAQLAQNEEDIEQAFAGLIEGANGVRKISFLNYLGNDQNMHPKVLYFKDGWNGYKYWMGYTPYPFGRTQDENPSIAVSNDRYYWETPPGLTNPLDDYPGGTNQGGTNSDAHLVYREDIDTLELWWRTYAIPGVVFFRRTTKDGINWTPKESMKSEEAGVSPAIIFEDGKYKIWDTVGGGGNRTINYSESLDSSGKSWTPSIPLDIDYSVVNPWHLDMIASEKGYEIIVSERGTDDKSRDFFHILQRYDGTFTKPVRIMAQGHDDEDFDSRYLYRPSILKEQDMYYLYSSFAQESTGIWGMSISKGRDIRNLKGVDFDKKIITLEDGQVVKNLNIQNVKAIVLPASIAGGPDVIFESFVGGEPGDIIPVIAFGSNSSAVFKFSESMYTPNNSDVRMGNEHKIAFIYVNPSRYSHVDRRYNIGISADMTPKPIRNVVTLNPGQILEEYDVSEVGTFIIPHVHGETITFKSLVNAEIGQEINVICSFTTSQASFENSTELKTPGGDGLTISGSSDSTKRSAKLLCTNRTGSSRFIVE